MALLELPREDIARARAELAASRDAGWLEANVAEDQRFAFLRGVEQFEQLIARSASRSAENDSALRVTPQIPFRAKN